MAPETTWTAEPFVPDDGSWDEVRDAADGCRGCPLHADATQTVFGQGPLQPRLVLVGEQPGDVEDRKGHPFVGPAGKVLWECVEAAGGAPGEVYATNAVKHFKHEQRGKRRIHQKPTTAEVEACWPWLHAELRLVDCDVVVALGATAARALLGTTTAIGSSRGRTFALRRSAGDVAPRQVVVTYHPSAVLRADERAAEVRAALVTDLRRAFELAGAGTSA